MLTRKQLELLEFISKRVAQEGVPPSFEEMKDALDLRSKSGIHRLITALEERGFIRRLAHRARAIEVIKLPDALSDLAGPELRVIDGDMPDTPRRSGRMAVDTGAHDVPLMGRIAAGVPIEAISTEADRISVPRQMVAGKAPHYALEVRGDSMIDAGINDGDVVVIRETSTADEGDIVVALVEGHEATLKTYRRNGRLVVLEAANPAYAPRVLPEDQVKVQGRLVGLIRTY